jgi:hypothetical protein
MAEPVVRCYTSEYGKCTCSGIYDKRTVEVRMTVAERPIVLAGVPQGACPLCGSRVYKSAILNALELLMRSDSA